MRCPTCEKDFLPANSQALPFCSKRCWQIDLGRWLKESYSVPVTRSDDEDDFDDEDHRLSDDGEDE